MTIHTKSNNSGSILISIHVNKNVLYNIKETMQICVWCQVSLVWYLWFIMIYLGLETNLKWRTTSSSSWDHIYITDQVDLLLCHSQLRLICLIVLEVVFHFYFICGCLPFLFLRSSFIFLILFALKPSSIFFKKKLRSSYIFIFILG